MCSGSFAEMCNEAKEKDNPPTLSAAGEDWVKNHLPFGLKSFVPWIKYQFGRLRQEWRTLSVLAVILLALFYSLVLAIQISPLKNKLSSTTDEKNRLQQVLAPYQAAGERYFSSIPTAERLTALLVAITNSTADVKELRRLQERKATLELSIVGEGSGWANLSEPLSSNSVVYMPFIDEKTELGFHLIVANTGNLLAEVIHVSFICPTQQQCIASGWQDLAGTTREFGFNKFLATIDAIYPESGYNLNALRFLPPSAKWFSMNTVVKIDGKNMERYSLPIEFFFFPTLTNMQPFASTNRTIWKSFVRE